MSRDLKTTAKTIAEETRARSNRNRAIFTVLSGPSTGEVLSIPRGVTTSLGRSDECAMRFDDKSLSRVHGHMLTIGEGYVYSDERSTNGSFLNGERLDKATRLTDGDKLQLGKETLLRFSIVDEAEEQALRALYEAATHDPLTGVFNRRTFERRAAAEITAAIQTSSPLSVIVIDADHFKRINDTLGHLAGDEVLRGLGRVLREASATGEVPARWGGEELVIAAPKRDVGSAFALAEWIRGKVEAETFVFDGAPIRVTTSAGVASIACAARAHASGPIDLAALLAVADQRLYKAKQAGRNRVVGDGP